MTPAMPARNSDWIAKSRTLVSSIRCTTSSNCSTSISAASSVISCEPISAEGGGFMSLKQKRGHQRQRASMNAALNRSGTRNRRSLALVVSTSTTARGQHQQFASINQQRRSPSAAGVQSAAMPTGKKMFTSSVISTSCLIDAPHSISAR